MRAPAAVLIVVVLAGCGGSAPRPRPATTDTRPTGTIVATIVTAPPPKAEPRPKPKPHPDPGSLPQTDQLPAANTAGFYAEMQALWDGVQANSPARARQAFFPEGAYIQVKAIGDAQGDYTGRLLADYGLDIAAAHALLGAHPDAAHLVGAHVPQGYAHWVPPGACYNRVGYYELPNARLVYRLGDLGLHSFGIASMISWRGVWYVVHLGAIVRSAAGGAVDDPSAGVGTSVPSSTC